MLRVAAMLLVGSSDLAAMVGLAARSSSIPDAPRASSGQTLQRWMPGRATCGGKAVSASDMRRPYTALSANGASTPPRNYRFRIDSMGRARSITGDAAMWDPTVEDIAPSLAASRFHVSGAMVDCTIHYTAETLPLSEAPVGDFVSYSLTPISGPLPEAGWARIRPVGTDCDKEPRPQWLRAISPDYLKLAGEPGQRDWSLVGYDLDQQGHPKAVGMVASTGNVALDRAAIVALSRSRQTQGPRRGCLNPYVRLATKLPAPTEPTPAAFRPADATCPRNPGWDSAPVLTYPESWRRRSIEGWAIVTYDVAPSGTIANVRAVASEPSDEFGKAAIGIVAAARKASTSAGYVGCVDKVRYRMGPGTPSPARPARRD